MDETTRTTRRLPPAFVGSLALLAIVLMTIQFRHLALVRDARYAAEQNLVDVCYARVDACASWLDGPGRVLVLFGRDCAVECSDR